MFLHSDFSNSAEPRFMTMKQRIKDMKDLFSYGMSPRDLTVRNLDTLERDIRDMIKEINRILSEDKDILNIYLVSVDALLIILHDVVHNLNLAIDILEMPRTLKRREQFYDIYRKCGDYLGEAYKQFNI